MKTLKTLSLVAVIIAAQSSLQAMSKIKENFNNAKLKVKTSLAQTYATGKKHGFFSTNVIDASLKAPLSVPTKHAVFENTPSTINNHSFDLEALPFQSSKLAIYNQIRKISWKESPREGCWKGMGIVDHEFSVNYTDDRTLCRQYLPSYKYGNKERIFNQDVVKSTSEAENVIDAIEYEVLNFKNKRAQYNDQCAQSNIKNVTNLSQDTYL